MIIGEMQAQGRHRRFIESVVVWSDVIRAQTGQFFGFILAGFMIYEGTILIREGRSTTGFEAIGVGITAVVGPFLYKQVQERLERQENKRRE